MTNGIDLNGFDGPKVNDVSPWPVESYSDAPTAAFPAADVTIQGPAGSRNLSQGEK